MNFLRFKDLFYPYQIFSTKEVLKTIPGFDTRRLVEWQQKGYLQKIRNNWYLFSEIKHDEHFRFLIANRIYSPSYISLESAMAYYNFIPEATFSNISVSSLKTKTFQTSSGRFVYRHLKPANMFGYKLVANETYTIKIAHPEKAIIDFLYLNPDLKTVEDMEGVRWNYSMIKDTIDPDLLKEYLNLFRSKALSNRANLLIKKLND
jgi:predicted transcriptional regulator of viral defense system